MMKEMSEPFGEVIFAYGRTQAIVDGVLIDVTKTAQEAGFTIPVALTDSVWNEFIEWTGKNSKQQTYQDTEGRLWDVLSKLRFAIAKNHTTDCLFYRLYVVPRDGKSRKAKPAQLKALIGADDNGKPVITIMLPNED
jgi:hypothetical protein